MGARAPASSHVVAPLHPPLLRAPWTVGRDAGRRAVAAACKKRGRERKEEEGSQPALPGGPPSLPPASVPKPAPSVAGERRAQRNGLRVWESRPRLLCLFDRNHRRAIGSDPTGRLGWTRLSPGGRRESWPRPRLRLGRGCAVRCTTAGRLGCLAAGRLSAACSWAERPRARFRVAWAASRWAAFTVGSGGAPRQLCGGPRGLCWLLGQIHSKVSVLYY